MPELFIPFLTALDNCLLCFSEYIKFTSDCAEICRLLYALYYILFFLHVVRLLTFMQCLFCYLFPHDFCLVSQ